jgi:signal transduction histidine kinase/CheY-like chemotaxis protein
MDEAAPLSEADHVALLQSGLDHISQGITVTDRALRLVGWNRRFFTMLDFPEELACLGTTYETFIRINAERGEYGPGDIADLVAQRVRTARAFKPHEFERMRPSGQIIAVRGEPLPQGGFVTVYTDVTEQRRQEQLIRERNDALLVQAQRMEAVGQLTGGLAHDFNNLLTVILGNLAALEERVGGEVFREYVEPAIRAGQRGVGITRRLLAFARQQVLEPVPVDVAALVAGSVTLLRRSLPSSIAIESTAESCWPALADPGQLEGAIVNLALNARDAMPGGGTLTFGVAPASPAEAAGGCAPGDYVQITVTDTGTGMDADTLARAFEPFFTTKTFGTGSGLGLSMVYGFARQSGGDIRIASAPGKGSTVSLLLPRAYGAVAGGTADAAAPANGAGELVLLVEDDDDVRLLIRRQLLELGYKVLEARDGAEGQALLRSIPEIAVLVSDVIMPGSIDGTALARTARAMAARTRIVLISGFSPDGAQAAEWPTLHKPFSKEQLARAIQR